MKNSLPEDIKFIPNVGDGKETVCLMSARSLLDGRPFGDDHPSATIRAAAIAINDNYWWKDDAERTRILLPVALDKRLCASNVQVSTRLELLRCYLCARYAQQWTDDVRTDAALAAVESHLAGVTGIDLEAAAEEATEATAWAAVGVAEAARAAAAEAAVGVVAAAMASRAAAWEGTGARRTIQAAQWAAKARPEKAGEIRASAIELLFRLCELTE